MREVSTQGNKSRMREAMDNPQRFLSKKFNAGACDLPLAKAPEVGWLSWSDNATDRCAEGKLASKFSNLQTVRLSPRVI
jgi:hypothetical protein